MISILFFMLAAACYGVCSHLLFHNVDKTPYEKFSFWGSQSWKRKYKRAAIGKPATEYNLYAAPDNAYYKFFNIKYREAFPWSATALVFITDGYHFMQWWMIKFLMLAVTMSSGHFDWVLFMLLWIGWGVCFNIVYVKLKR